MARTPLLVLALVSACTRAAPPPAPAPPPPKVMPLTRTWEKVIPSSGIPQGLSSLRVTECEKCHAEVKREWEATAHGMAWVDPQFQAEWKKDGNLWLCVNCHAPLGNQQPERVLGLADGDFRRPVTEPNPLYDEALRHEGITCASCHIRDGFVVTGVAVRGTAPHASKTDAKELSHELCTRCHNAKADLTKTLVCTFDTGDDWGSTELPGQKVSCLDCHMPYVGRVAMDGGVLLGRRHDFLGAGIPKKLVPGQAVVARTGLAIDLTPDPRGYAKGETAKLRAVITNRFAGHTVPTGDVERWIEVHFSLLDDKGAQRWTHVERFGEKWEWWPEAKRLSDNSLKRNASREVELAVPMPKDTASAALEVRIVNHRMTPEIHASAKLPSDYPLSIEAFRSTTPLKLRRGK